MHKALREVLLPYNSKTQVNSLGGCQGFCHNLLEKGRITFTYFCKTSFPPAYIISFQTPAQTTRPALVPNLKHIKSAQHPHNTECYSLVTLVTGGSCRAAAAGLALLPTLLGEEAVGTAVAARPRVSSQAEALPRRVVAPSAAHRAAVAQVTCKGKRNRRESLNCRMLGGERGRKAHLMPTSLLWDGRASMLECTPPLRLAIGNTAFCHFARSCCFAEVLS